VGKSKSPKAEAPAEAISLPLAFVGAEGTPVLHANIFVLQQLQGDFILTIGQAAPLLVGDVEEQRKQAQQLGTIPVTTIARVVVSRERLSEIIDILQMGLKESGESKEGG